MDFICHGTPSMQMLRDHLEYLEKKYQKKVIMVDFRSKKLGWKKHCLYCRFDDGSEYVAPWQDDYYFQSTLPVWGATCAVLARFKMT